MKRGPKLDNLTYKDALRRLAEKARAELERMGHSVEGRTDADLVQSYTRARKQAKIQHSAPRHLSQEWAGPKLSKGDAAQAELMGQAHRGLPARRSTRIPT